MTTGKHISIIGGGSAGLFLAAQLAASHDVHLYQRGKMLGRKFLVAGKGGFNLTNSAEGAALLQAYTGPPALLEAVARYDSQAFRAWLATLGIHTYVGSSGRVFPTVGTKPIAVLQALRHQLDQRGVQVHLHHTWKGVAPDGRLLFDHQGQRTAQRADTVVLAMGGASWPKTGSDGAWLPEVAAMGIPTRPFAPSNCGVEIDWAPDFVHRFEGQPLKNIALQIGGQVVQGEALVTRCGLEGNALYPLIPHLRQALHNQAPATLYLNLKPYSKLEDLHKKVRQQRTKPKNYSYTLRLSKAAIALAKQFTNKDTYTQPLDFAQAIQQLAIPVKGLRPLEEAISTVGGICWSGLAPNFSLLAVPNWYAIGELLDWDAPTGGFLLQGCYAMAASCAHVLNQTTR